MSNIDEIIKSAENILFKKKTPVPFREFVESEDYCNEKSLYEFWQTEGEKIPEVCNELVIDGSLGSGKCVSVKKRISTSEGYRNSDFVFNKFCHSSEGFQEVTGFAVEQPDGSYGDVSHLYSEVNTKCKRIKTHFGSEIIATYDHPILCLKHNEYKPRLVKCLDLEEGDYVLNRKFIPFEFSLSKKEAIKYFIYGYAVGDSCYSPNNGGYIQYKGTRVDLEWLREQENTKLDGGERAISSDSRTIDCSTLSIRRNLSILSDLITEGQDAYTKTLSEDVFKSKSVAFSVLIGLLASDGGYESKEYMENKRRQPRLEYSTSSEKLKNDLCDLFDYLSIVYVVEQRTPHYTYKGERREGKKSWRFRFEHSFYKRAYTMIQRFVDFIELPNSRMRRIVLCVPKETNYWLQNVDVDKEQRILMWKDLQKAKCKMRGIGPTAVCKDCKFSNKKSGRINEYQCSVRKSVSLTISQKYSPYSYFRFIENFDIEEDSTDFTGKNWNISVFKDYVYSKVERVDDCVEDVWDVTVPSTHLFMAGNHLNHNTTFSVYWFAYKVYCMFLNGPSSLRKELGLSENSDLYGLYFSVSMTTARKSGYKQLQGVFKSCKWFKENMPVNEDLQSSVQFPSARFEVDYASSEGHQISLNVIIFILDEANFRSGVGEGTSQEYLEVTQIYSQLIDRLYSRFARPDGSSAGFAMLVSSASYQSSFAEKRRELVENDKWGHHIRAVTYKVKPQNYSKETFEVFIGTGTIEPQIINSEQQKQNIIKSLNMEGTNLYEKLFEKVPVSIKKFYIQNINLALQNHSGVPTQIKGRFLQDITLLTKSYSEEERFIFSQQVLSLSADDDIQLIDYLIEENIVYPERPHSLFLDLSLTGDSGGFSCFRFDGERDNVKFHTHVFTLEVVPPPAPSMTKISKFRTFMSDFAQIVNVVAFGTDQFQSAGLRQDVKEDLDLPDIRLSLDSSDVPFIMWVRSLMEKAIKMRYVQKLQTEVEEAEHDLKRRRIIKKSGSTDDLFQSVVGAWYLSETIGSDAGSIEDLLGDYNNINVVGQHAYKRMLAKLGYKVRR